jgi:hypothetical protein
VDLENIPLRKDALRFLEPAIEVFSFIFLTLMDNACINDTSGTGAKFTAGVVDTVG